MQTYLIRKALTESSLSKDLKSQIKEALIVIDSLPKSPVRIAVDSFALSVRKKGFTSYYENDYGVNEAVVDKFVYAKDDRKTFPACQDSEPVKKGMTEGEMLKLALKLPIIKAIKVMEIKILSGYFNKQNSAFIIFLTDKYEGTKGRLLCEHGDNRNIGLSVNIVRESFGWRSRDNASFVFDKVAFLRKAK